MDFCLKKHGWMDGWIEEWILLKCQITRKWCNLQDKATVTMANQQQVVYDLSIGATFSDHERSPNPQFNIRSTFLLLIPTLQDRHIFRPTVDTCN